MDGGGEQPDLAAQVTDLEGEVKVLKDEIKTLKGKVAGIEEFFRDLGRRRRAQEESSGQPETAKPPAAKEPRKGPAGTAPRVRMPGVEYVLEPDDDPEAAAAFFQDLRDSVQRPDAG